MRNVLLVSLGVSTVWAQPLPRPTAPPPSLTGKLTVFARGLSDPVALIAAPDDGRLYVVEKTGTIRVLGADGAPSKTPLLDLRGKLSLGSEQGLLGLAFHPRFKENRRFYVAYTDKDKDVHYVEYRAAGDRADPASARELFAIDHPYSNHNGGHVLFGPDGKLYLGTGDGGAGFDPHQNGQNPKSLLGKMLRFDVDKPNARPEILAIGLRNPWRYAFDAGGNLWIADVGQHRWEEIDVIPLAQLDGANFGWSVLEGSHCLRPGCSSRGFIPPVVEYGHDEGCSVSGGVVYRGRAFPELTGMYLFSDYCTAILRGVRKGGPSIEYWDLKNALDPKQKLGKVSAFGEGADGELYILSLDGFIYALTR